MVLETWSSKIFVATNRNCRKEACVLHVDAENFFFAFICYSPAVVVESMGIWAEVSVSCYFFFAQWKHILPKVKAAAMKKKITSKQFWWNAISSMWIPNVKWTITST